MVDKTRVGSGCVLKMEPLWKVREGSGRRALAEASVLEPRGWTCPRNGVGAMLGSVVQERTGAAGAGPPPPPPPRLLSAAVAPACRLGLPRLPRVTT